MQILPFGTYGFSIAIYVISIMLIISGIVLGFGYALNDKRLKEFGKNEIYQSILNGALVGGLLAAFSQDGIINQAIYSIATANGASMQCQQFLSQNAAICFAYNYLTGTGYTLMGIYHPSVLSSVLVLLTALLSLSLVLGIIGAAKLSIIVITISFSSIVNPLAMQLQYIIKILITIAIGATVQSSVLAFISLTSLSIILPAGLILRSFYPTRKLGGFLIALMLGLYVVLPLSYVMNALIANQYILDVNSTSVQQVAASASSIESSIYGNLQAAPSNSFLSEVESIFINPLSSLANSFQSLVNSLMDDVSYFIVYTFILPAFSLIITGISIREFATILGSEASFGKFNVL